LPGKKYDILTPSHCGGPRTRNLDGPDWVPAACSAPSLSRERGQGRLDLIPPARATRCDGAARCGYPLSRPPARATRLLLVTPHRRSHQSSGTARARADGKTSKGPDSKNSHCERPSFLPRNLSRPETRKTHTCAFAPARLLETWRHPPEHFDTVRGSRGRRNQQHLLARLKIRHPHTVALWRTSNLEREI
jgi:hypothetical protein